MHPVVYTYIHVQKRDTINQRHTYTIIYMCTYTHIYMYTCTFIYMHTYALMYMTEKRHYGVATVSRIDKIIGLFCKRDL